jgi:RHS repeat-associated protein
LDKKQYCRIFLFMVWMAVTPAGQALAQSLKPTITWNVDTNGFWDVAANWKDSSGIARVPNSNDDVGIDRGSIRPTVTIRSSQPVHSLSSAAPLVISGGGGLGVAAASALSDGVTLDNGSIVLNGPLTIAGNSQWKSGDILNNGGLTNTGTLILSGPDTKYLGGVLNNTGNIVHEGGALLIDVPIGSAVYVGTLNNHGLYDIRGDVTFSHNYADAAVVTNTGTFRKSAGTGAATFNLPFNNNGGTIDAESGTIALAGGTQTGGTFSAGLNGNTSATLQFAGDHVFTGAFTGSGKGAVQLIGSTFTAGATGATLNFTGGLLQWVTGLVNGGTAGWHNSGTLTVIQGGSRVLLYNRFDNAGTLAISGPSSMDIDGCGNFTNLPGAVLDFQGDGAMFDGGTCAGGHTLTNQGTVRKSVGTLSTLRVSGFNNTPAGAIDVRAGKLQLQNGNNTGGTFTVAEGATLDLTGGASATYSGTYTGSGPGTVTLSSGFLVAGSSGATFNFPSGLFAWTGGIIAGAAPGLTNSGTLTLSGTGTKYLGGVLNNTGNIAHLAGALQVDAPVGSALYVGTLNNGGLYDMRADVALTRNFLDSAVINNTGTLRKSGGTGLTQISVPLNNTGTLEVHSGTVTAYAAQFARNPLIGRTLTAGTWHVFSNAALNFVDLLFAGDPLIATNKAVVTIDGPGAGLPTIAGLKTNDGSLNLLNGASLSISGSLSNSGRITLGAGSKLTTAGFSQVAAGSLGIQIGGRPSTGQFGQFASSLNAALGGSLNVALVNGFGLTSGDKYTSMTFPSHSGSFARITGTSAGLRADLTATALTLTAQGSESDLAPTSITIVTPTVKPGQPSTVNYAVKNMGGTTAKGDWYDAVYLSSSPFVTPDAVLLGTVHHVGDVAEQSSYTGTLTAAEPPILPGGYRVLVVTDSTRRVADVNRDNNTLASTGTLVVSIPMLGLGRALADKIANGQDLFYHLVLPPGADVTLSASYTVSRQAELYIRFGALPTRTAFDLSTLGDLSNLNPKLVENNVQGGDYYILLHGLTASGVAGQAFTLTAASAQFQVTSIDPQIGLNTSTQTITLGGTEFTQQTTVSLVAGNGSVFAASSVTFTDSTRIAAVFDLSRIPVASYTVRATAGKQTAVAPTLFRVTDSLVGHFASTVILSPGKVRVGSPIPVQVEFHGFPDTFTPVPLVEVDATNVAAGQQHQQLVDPALPQFFKDELSFGVVYDPQPHAAGITSDFGLSLASLVQTIDWDGQKDRLRPADIPADAWDAIWANLRPRLKTTVGDFYALLHEDAQALAQNGVSTNRLNLLLRFEIAMANDQSPVSAGETALDLAYPAPGLPLKFTRTFLGSSIAARYHLGRLGRGWADGFDVSAHTDAATNRVTVQQAALTRSFTPNADGSYSSVPGDYGILTHAGGVYQLREKTGVIIVFRADGSLDYVEDKNRNRITAGYSGERLTTLTHSNGSVMSLSYDGNGRIRQVTDPAGRTATYTYDSGGQQLLSITTAAGTTAYSYTGETIGPHAFALASVTAPSGAHRFFEYDAQGRLQKAQRDQGAEVLKYSYDTASVRVTDAKNRAVTLFYDDLDRVRRTEDALGRLREMRFDETGNLIYVAAQGGGPATFSYDSQGNLATAVDPLGISDARVYDTAFSQLTSDTDSLSQSTTFNLDANGNTVSASYANGSRDQYTYDAQGNVTRIVDRNGKITNYQYDTRGLLLGVQLADGSRIDYTYDSRANRTSATDARGTISMQYDSANRLVHIAYPRGRSLTYSYDNGNRLVQSIDQSGFTLNYNYDPAGRLNSVMDARAGTIVTYNYDATGQLTRAVKGNGGYTTFDYDGVGRVAHLVNFSANNSVSSRFDYTYDELGRRDSVTTLDGKATYGYDDDNRLTSVTLPNGRALTYVYDTTGSRIGVTDNGVATAYNTNNLDEYVSIGTTSQSYDAAGDLASASGTMNASYAYDALNRLVSVTNSSGVYNYEYDALGHRIAVVHNGRRTEYLVDPSGNVVGEFNSAGEMTAHFAYGASLVSRIDSQSGAAYYEFDAIGSTAALIGANGQTLNTYRYLPFGESLSVSENVPNPFRYVGAFGVQDDNNGLDFMRMRYYAPVQGRFTQPDPLGVATGPNAYSYAGNNPAELIDPNGLWYVDFNFGAYAPPPIFGGVTFGVLVGTGGVYPYAGGGFGTPGPGFSLTASTSNPSTGWGVAIEGSFGVAAQVGTSLTDSGEPIEGGEYGELGVGTPGVSLTYLYTFNPFFVPGSEPYDPMTDSMGRPIQQAEETEQTGDIQPCLPEFQSCPIAPVPNLTGAGRSSTTQVAPKDPNYISGPGGVGAANFIPGNVRMPYIIGFENQPSASAPAQQVVMTLTLDSNLDPSTLQLGDLGFGKMNVHVPEGTQTFHTRVDQRSSRGVFIDVTAELNGQVITWKFASIDPATGKPPTDPEVGFLPPDRAPPNGEGYVTYSVRPLSGLASGTRVEAQASVVFDVNGAVATNLFLNTLDTAGPVSRVDALPATETTTSFQITWHGSDTGGPGIGSYDVFVSTDDGPFQAFVSGTTTTSKQFTGDAGHKYAFYSIAHDLLGNSEHSKSIGDANTRIAATTPPFIQCTGCYFLIDAVRTTMAFNVSVPGSRSTFMYNYRTAAAAVQFISTTTSRIAVNSNGATFSGQGTLNGQAGYNFAVTAKDGGSAGSGLDTASITITGPNGYTYSASGAIAGGDIVVKP